MLSSLDLQILQHRYSKIVTKLIKILCTKQLKNFGLKQRNLQHFLSI